MKDVTIGTIKKQKIFNYRSYRYIILSLKFYPAHHAAVGDPTYPVKFACILLLQAFKERIVAD